MTERERDWDGWEFHEVDSCDVCQEEINPVAEHRGIGARYGERICLDCAKEMVKKLEALRDEL